MQIKWDKRRQLYSGAFPKSVRTLWECRSFLTVPLWTRQELDAGQTKLKYFSELQRDDYSATKHYDKQL